MSLEQYKVEPWLPVGSRGHWMIDRMTVSRSEATDMRLYAAMNGHNRWCRPGRYTRLRGPLKPSLARPTYGVMMSDTHDEIRDHLPFMSTARGSVLIHGLGLGMVAAACLRRPEVTSVTVVEIDEDVIALVEPHLRAAFPERDLEVIAGDAFTWKIPRGKRWTCAWHDIWPEIDADNLRQMAELRKRFARRLEEQGWQDSWAREICEREAALDRSERNDILRRASAMFGPDIIRDLAKRLP